MEDGRIHIYNAPFENPIRSIVVGLKDWLFAGSGTAERIADAIMSLLARAKAAA